jgi:NADH-quinone oxidoreductase subunit G
MPAINQQEGTLTSINTRVNPTNAALEYKGYELNDFANALGIKADLVVEYTAKLPTTKGFQSVEFDSLPNRYENDGTELRGYMLANGSVKISGDETVQKYNNAKLEGTIVYIANPVRQFSAFTNKTTALSQEGGVYMSEEFLSKSELNAGDKVRIKGAHGELVVKIISDNKIAGAIALLPTYDSKINTEVITSAYRFATASIERV